MPDKGTKLLAIVSHPRFHKLTRAVDDDKLAFYLWDNPASRKYVLTLILEATDDMTIDEAFEEIKR